MPESDSRRFFRSLEQGDAIFQDIVKFLKGNAVTGDERVSIGNYIHFEVIFWSELNGFGFL